MDVCAVPQRNPGGSVSFGCPGVKAGKTAMKKQTNIFTYLGVDYRGYLALLYEGMLFPSIYGYHAHHWILFNMHA